MIDGYGFGIIGEVKHLRDQMSEYRNVLEPCEDRPRVRSCRKAFMKSFALE
jgi:hypothetical protein